MIIYRFIVTGTLSGNAYILKFSSSMFDSLPNFTSATWTMNVLASGTEDITSTTSLALTSLSQTVSNPTYTNLTLNYNQGQIVTSDVLSNTALESYQVVEMNFMQEFPTLTCSKDGSTTIYYSIENFNPYDSFKWVSIDPVTGVLNINASAEVKVADYSFSIKSTIVEKSTSNLKPITLKVLK